LGLAILKLKGLAAQDFMKLHRVTDVSESFKNEEVMGL